jgi:fructosamine-3-kinase
MEEARTDVQFSTAQAEAVLAGWLGPRARCTGLDRLHGGMVNSVWRLAFDREPFEAVIKVRPTGDRALEVEAGALRYLRGHTRFPCPDVYHEDSSGRDVPFAYLLMEALPGVLLGSGPLGPGDRRTIERELAEALLELHSHTRDTFGDLDARPGERQWAQVFVPRLAHMRAEMAGRLPAEVLRDVDRALEEAEPTLRRQGRPALVHGDIWAGNILVRSTDTGWHLVGVVDPGAQYADVEYELAYLQVFGTAGDAFFDVYTARSPLRPGYELRRLYYWLNTYMIHVWYFGDAHYREMTARVAAEIGRQV